MHACITILYKSAWQRSKPCNAIAKAWIGPKLQSTCTHASTYCTSRHGNHQSHAKIANALQSKNEERPLPKHFSLSPPRHCGSHASFSPVTIPHARKHMPHNISNMRSWLYVCKPEPQFNSSIQLHRARGDMAMQQNQIGANEQSIEERGLISGRCST